MLDRGPAPLGRTLVDRDDLIEQTAAHSTLPDVRTRLEETVRSLDSDLVVLEEFGPRDGRVTADQNS